MIHLLVRSPDGRPTGVLPGTVQRCATGRVTVDLFGAVTVEADARDCYLRRGDALLALDLARMTPRRTAAAVDRLELLVERSGGARA